MQKAADITDLDAWLYAYKRKKPGIILGGDGRLTVQNTKKPEEAPTVIPHTLGVDAYRVLNDGVHAELRAAATAKLTELEVANMGVVDEAYEACNAAEMKYMDDVETWEQNHNAENAIAVAKSQRLLYAAEQKYREAKYKHRSILSINGLPRLAIDYRTKDDRALPFTLELARYETSKSAGRALSITEAGTA